MLPLFLLLSGPRADVAQLDALARGRDARGLLTYSGPALQDAKDFVFLVRNGAYGTGRKGWHAYQLDDPAGGKSYVVFGTPLTTEDYGEYVFEYAGGKLTRLEDERDARGYKVLHYDFDLSFAPKEKRATVMASVKLRRSADAAACVHFRLSPNYTVSKVTDGQGAPLLFAQASGVVSVASPAAAESTVKMEYSGVVDQPQFAGAIVDDEVMLTNDYWWPNVARGPATVTTTAHVPADWLVVTHGNKLQDAVEGGGRTVKYQMDVPICYLSFSAGKFLHEEKKVGKVTYHVWSRSMTADKMKLQLELMPPIIEFYSRFSPFPFDGFGAMVTDLYGGGALEAYSFATYGTGWLPDEDAHEPAHTWFGGIIANTYLNSYWNESFADFCDAFFEREVSIGNTTERRRAFVAQTSVGREYAQATVEGTGAADGSPASSMGYGKGAAVLQQLEREIGTEKMVESMRKWIRTNPKGEPGEWKGFEAAVGATTGKDMKWFFDEWNRKPGAPSFEVREIGYYGGEVHGLVDFHGDAYRLTCEVYAEFADGTSTNVDVVLNPGLKPDVSSFSFKLPKKPRFLSFDPYDRILRERTNTPTMRFTERVQNMAAVMDPRHPEYGQVFGSMADKAVNTVPADHANVLFVGHPDTMPVMRSLCKQVGFVVNGDKLTYDGTTIDLREGAAMALVDLGSGKVCGIALGKVLRSPNCGLASLCLTDKYGRFLRGRTEPRRDGPLTFRLP